MKVNNNYEEFYWNLLDHERLIFDKLKRIIETTIPQVSMKMALGVPFFYLNYRMCFIWPASVPWGGNVSGVALGFCNAYMFDEDKALLKFESRKKVGSIDYDSWQAIDEELVRYLLMKAEAVDYKLKTEKVKR